MTPFAPGDRVIVDAEPQRENDTATVVRVDIVDGEADSVLMRWDDDGELEPFPPDLLTLLPPSA